MATTFEKLLETSGFDNEAKAMIQEAWESQLSEAKEQAAAELREEFAKKFQHDKNVLIESIDTFLRDKLQTELADFAKDKQALVAERVQYKAQVREHIAKLDNFMVEHLAGEVKSLREDKKAMKQNVAQLEGFLIQKLSEEIQDFRRDKLALIEQRVKLVGEGKKQIAEAKASFIKKAAFVVESTINDVLSKEISQYKDDITAARENDFGRQIFEAFVGQYMTSHLNEGTEISKMKKVLESKERVISKMQKEVSNKQSLVESVNAELNATKDRLVRNKAMSKLMAPLGKDKRKVMEELLRTVPTSKLNESYDKYLPAVLNEQIKPSQTKRVLAESLSVKDGSKSNTKHVFGDDSSTLAVELEKIKNLAGI